MSDPSIVTITITLLLTQLGRSSIHLAQTDERVLRCTLVLLHLLSFAWLSWIESSDIWLKMKNTRFLASGRRVLFQVNM